MMINLKYFENCPFPPIFQFCVYYIPSHILCSCFENSLSCCMWSSQVANTDEFYRVSFKSDTLSHNLRSYEMRICLEMKDIFESKEWYFNPNRDHRMKSLKVWDSFALSLSPLLSRILERRRGILVEYEISWHMRVEQSGVFLSDMTIENLKCYFFLMICLSLKAACLIWWSLN